MAPVKQKMIICMLMYAYRTMTQKGCTITLKFTENIPCVCAEHTLPVDYIYVHGYCTTFTLTKEVLEYTVIAKYF